MSTQRRQCRIPGVLSRGQLQILCRSRWIEGVRDSLGIDRSAIDLTISGEGYEMIQGSVKPFGQTYAE